MTVKPAAPTFLFDDEDRRVARASARRAIDPMPGSSFINDEMIRAVIDRVFYDVEEARARRKKIQADKK